MVGYVGDTVFPSRPYKRKLDEMSDRLEDVEQELKRLKRDVTVCIQ
jgi:predicted DNA-binding transcriptional regulator